MSQLDDILASMDKDSSNKKMDDTDANIAFLKKDIDAPAFINSSNEGYNAPPSSEDVKEEPGILDKIKSFFSPYSSNGTPATTGVNNALIDAQNTAKLAAQKPSEDDNEEDGEEEPSTPKSLLKPNTTKQLISALQNQTPSPAKPLFGSDLSDDALKSAQEQGNYINLIAGLGKASNLIGAGFAHNKPNNETYNDLQKQAGIPANNILQRRQAIEQEMGAQLKQFQLSSESEKHDGNSLASKFAREVTNEMLPGLKIPEGTPADAIEKMVGPIEKIAAAREATKTRQLYQGMLLDQKNENKQSKQNENFANDIDPSRARSGAMGDNQKRVNAAGRIDGLLQQFPDGNIPKAQTEELALSVGALLTNGSPAAVSTVNNLVPHTMVGKASDIAQWVTSEPMGLHQQAFVKLFADTARREKQIAEDQIFDAQVKKAKAQELKSTNPDLFYQTFAGKNIKGLSTKEDIDAALSGKLSNSSQGGPKVGSIEEGHRFKGGNPADPNSWEKVE